MTTIIGIAATILGMYLSMRLIAALYGIIDHWYRIRTAYPKVILGILVWGAITICLTISLGDYVDVFLLGFALFVLIHLGTYALGRLALVREVRSLENQ